MATGIVKEFNDKRGFGLLFPLGEPADSDLIFFHRTQIIGATAVPIGSEVRFQKVRSDRNGIQAAQVELLELGGRRTLADARREEQRERNRPRA